MNRVPLSELNVKQLGELFCELGLKRFQTILAENEISGAMLNEFTSSDELLEIDSRIKPWEAKGWFKEIEKLKHKDASNSEPQQGWFPWIYGFFFGSDHSREHSIADLSASWKELRQTLNDSVTTLPRRYRESVRLASVNIFDEKGKSIGVAIFVSSRRIISAYHVFKTHYGFKNRQSASFNRSIVVKGLVHRPDNKVEAVEFHMIDYAENWDLVVLELGKNFVDANYFISLPLVGVNNDQGDNDEELGKLALISFTAAHARQAPQEANVSFCVCPAVKLTVSKHHLLYSCSLFSGDSGGAVLLSKDGSLRGIHQESVNQASEELRTGVTPAAMVKSINSLIRGLSSGFIGLRLDVVEVQEFILKK